MKHDISKLNHISSQVRRDIVRMVHSCQSGHPGGSLGCTDFLVALYFDVMKRKEGFDMKAKGEDVFYLSNGHISPVFYSVLAHAGYFDKSELATFRKLNSRLQGHPTTHEGLPGIRIASGSLGQGMSVAIGHAVGKKLDKDENLVFTLHGDGELQEGQNWEAIMYASHNKVDNLIATIDYNGQQIDGPTSKVLSLGNLKTKFEAFEWKVLEVENGNDMKEILTVLDEAKSFAGKGQPICILLKTGMGHGVDYMMGSHAWHGKAPNDEQLAKALDQLKETLGDY
ncbi:transketolase [Chryseobacterium wangxinyae]|uniref:transketolase n=1 Tax=Chryseobacterium sp. CY353 TaxID=2997334 RepID=UPI002270EDD3|nr:transketolase [Chryseobacterium sp. CY353]MCY0970455.1 transketolase [Chryseobacterium sp. CY353]